MATNEKKKIWAKTYRTKHKAQRIAYAKLWREKNHATIATKREAYNKKIYNTPEHRLRKMLSNAKAHSKVLVTATLLDLIALWEAQSGKCAVTGIAMETKPNRTTVASLDRLDSKAGYAPNNIRLVCWWVNWARNTMTDQKFIAWCHLVAKTNPLTTSNE